MLGFARLLMKSKFIILALLLGGYFMFMGDKQPPKPTSAWAVNAPAPGATVTPAKSSITDKVLGAADSAAKYAGVQEYTPTALRDQAVGNMNKTENALSKAGSGQD